MTEAAGASKGSFLHHFTSREQFLLELHCDVHDAMFLEIASARTGLAPGRQRLLAGARVLARLPEAAGDAHVPDRGADRPVDHRGGDSGRPRWTSPSNRDPRTMGEATTAALAPLLA